VPCIEQFRLSSFKVSLYQDFPLTLFEIKIFYIMDSWNVGSSSYVISDEPFIPDIVDDISDDNEYEE